MKTTHMIIQYAALALAILIIVSICGAIALLVGGVSSGISLGKMGSDTKAQDILSNNKDSILYIEIASSKVRIHEGDSLMAVTDNEYITIETQGNKLVAIEGKHKPIVNNETYLDIQLPSGFIFESVVITAGAVSLEADCDILADNFDLALGAGEVVLDRLVVIKEASIEGGTGSVIIKDGVVMNLDAELGVGNAELCLKIGGESDIEAGIGNVKLDLLGGRDSYELDISTGIGEATLDGKKLSHDEEIGNGENELSIDCGIGNVEITFR